MDFKQLLSLLVDYYTMNKLVEKYGLIATSEQIKETTDEIKKEIIESIEVK